MELRCGIDWEGAQPPFLLTAGVDVLEVRGHFPFLRRDDGTDMGALHRAGIGIISEI
jgi:hypothetical protein